MHQRTVARGAPPRPEPSAAEPCHERLVGAVTALGCTRARYSGTMREGWPLAALAAGLCAAALVSACAVPPVIHVSPSPPVPRGTPTTVRPAPIPPSSAPTAGPTTPTSSLAPTQDPVTPTAPVDVTPPSSPDGLAPVVNHISTTDRVAFITIDDGYSQDPAVVSLLRRRHIPVTAFLAVDALAAGHEYFVGVEKVTGQSVQNHTLTHPHLPKLGPDGQRAEICGAADTLGGWYGQRPWLFRPPYGDYDRSTRRAAHDCGMTTIVLWDVSLPHSVLRFASGSRFRPGDILLIHWRPNLVRDLPIALAAIADAGLHVASLQDYLPRPA